MVAKRLLAVFIVTCTIGLAVVLNLFQLHVHSVIPCLCSLQTESSTEGPLLETAFVQGDWHSEIWQKMHWFIVFHFSPLGDL